MEFVNQSFILFLFWNGIQVFQRIDILSKDFDNIVELELGAPWPLPPVEVTATLAHKFEITGSSSVKIIFEKTTVKTTGNLSQIPPLEIPQLPDALRPSTNRGSGDFDVNLRKIYIFESDSVDMNCKCKWNEKLLGREFEAKE
ncbi:putative plastid-lipid-associated protein 6, chloroplastic [Heracleum sosnowskyi]|uniref:Plastid-lipid-associated protein 6, chloroplastic n=1 Tax=Heracleum sosnowskyi TaxID=360622 RepID=A0AAD8IUL9_9APIA|nr:putative plastid-lipid-associated protein 6, chloroplastic [Heracleum sosnowskyi]